MKRGHRKRRATNETIIGANTAELKTSVKRAVTALILLLLLSGALYYLMKFFE